MSPKAPVFVPPRPNPGPEPPTHWLGPWALLLLFPVAAAVLGLWRRRRKLEARGRGRAQTDELLLRREGPPGERLIGWAHLLRETLADRFGPSWRARTTEEIADDPQLAALIGAESAARLVRILAEADRLKFSEAGGLPPEAWRSYGEEWEAWVSAFARAGASSRTTGM